MTTFPQSSVIDAAPDEALLAEIADEALNAFFAVVCTRLDDLYPESHTSGDVDPLESVDRERIALRWIHSHALNNATIAAANDD